VGAIDPAKTTGGRSDQDSSPTFDIDSTRADYVAHRIHARLPQHVELEDLVSAGVVGLIDAFNKFDRKKDVQFRTCAQIRIRGAIGRQPQESEVADELGMALASYRELVNAVKGLEIDSLHEARTDNPADEELVYIASSPEDDPLHRSMRSELAAVCRRR